jgi:fructan beta-fructosidase
LSNDLKFFVMKLILRFILLLVIAAWWMIACRPGSNRESTESFDAFNEPYRPAFHFSPDSMWMNDPNGMVWYQGEYHLFFQHFPGGNTWGPMHWGHAVSRDLVHWEQLPIALYPDSLGYIFSGSAVIDHDNRSGLGTAEHPPMVAIFTHHNPQLEATGSDLFQYQSIAYSTNRGRSWTKYEGNPVLNNPGIRDFRDPKVNWFEPGKKWIMTLAAQDRIMFYSSSDLIRWSYESEFGETLGAHGGVWECPDLFTLQVNGKTKWVLLVSLNPGGPNGGSGTQYFVGEFDGNRFISQNPSPDPLWIDYGKDNYAGVTWSGIPEEDGRRIFLGWMSNWQYANQVPTERWRNAMTLPRELLLVEEGDHIRIRSRPVGEIELLRVDKISLETEEIMGRKEILGPPDTGDGLLEMDLVIEPLTVTSGSPEGSFGIFLCNSQDTLKVEFDPGSQEVVIDRTRSGNDSFSPEFPGLQRAPLPAVREGRIRLHAFVDRASIELFINEGECVMTEIFFPSTPYDRLFLFTDEGGIRLADGKIYHLKNIRYH